MEERGAGPQFQPNGCRKGPLRRVLCGSSLGGAHVSSSSPRAVFCSWQILQCIVFGPSLQLALIASMSGSGISLSTYHVVTFATLATSATSIATAATNTATQRNELHHIAIGFCIHFDRRLCGRGRPAGNDKDGTIAIVSRDEFVMELDAPCRSSWSYGDQT